MKPQLGNFEGAKVAPIINVEGRDRQLASRGHIDFADNFLALAGDSRVSSLLPGVNVEMIILVSRKVFSVFRHADLAMIWFTKAFSAPSTVRSFGPQARRSDTR
jgi:hypothetical protein